ncbi:MAG: hypothetical protein AB9834_09790 [Lentimicrobium sp.]
MDRISCNMATMPSRERSLEETLNSILPQCDEVNVYLNNYDHVPSFLRHGKIRVYRSQDFMGDLGDVGKFFGCESWNGYAFTIDDKIIYPPEYVSTMIAAIEKHKRKAVVSQHGRILKPFSKSYYHDHLQSVRCLDENPADLFAHVLGTGVMAFHTDTFQVRLGHFPSTNMSDIWMSIALQKASIPVLLLKHPARWIQLSQLHDKRYSISAFCSGNDKPQTAAVNSIRWTIRTCP